MTRWEYLRDYSLTQEELDAKGLEGWELVCVVIAPEDFNRTWYYFKKPLVQARRPYARR